MPTLLLAIDDVALPIKKQLCYHISMPAVRPEPVLAPSPPDSSASDNLSSMFYGTVLHDGGVYRMWYYACHAGMNPDWPPEVLRQYAKYKATTLIGPPCYAESDDGIAWRKPALKQVMFKGSRQNNAIALPYNLTAGVNVIKDPDDPDPSRRYKMIYEFFPRYADPPMPGAGRMSTIAAAVSPDGLAWSHAGVPYVDQFMEQASLIKHDGKYIVYYQAGDAWGSHFSDGGHPSGRQGLARYSLDFNHWIDGYVESSIFPEPADPALRGCKGTYLQNHLGIGAASFGNVCVGLTGMWHNHPVFSDISCDLGLAISNDGLRYREPVLNHVFIAAADSPVKPVPGKSYHTNLTQGNGILNVGDKTLIYHGRWRNIGTDDMNEYYGDVALATLPRDRWGALGLFPNRDEGSVWSAPLRLPDAGFTVNADGASGIAFELADERFNLIPELSGVHSGKPAGQSGLNLPVAWPSSAPAVWRGRPVRIKAAFRRGPGAIPGAEPRLFAINVSGEK